MKSAEEPRGPGSSDPTILLIFAFATKSARRKGFAKGVCWLVGCVVGSEASMGLNREPGSLWSYRGRFIYLFI